MPNASEIISKYRSQGLGDGLVRKRLEEEGGYSYDEATALLNEDTRPVVREGSGTVEETGSSFRGLPTESNGVELAYGPTQSSGISSVSDANRAINQIQDNEINAVTAPPTAGASTDIVNVFEEVSTMFTGDNTAPILPNFQELQRKLLASAKVPDKMQSLDTLSAQEQLLRDQVDAEIETIQDRGGLRAKNALRINEVERVANNRLKTILRQKQILNNEINTSNTIIRSIMDAAKYDYETASDKYNSEVNKKFQMYNLARGIRNDRLSDIDREREFSRANLEVMYNNIADGTINYDELNESAKLKIQQLEMKAGMPASLLSGLVTKGAQGEMVVSNNITRGGQKYTQMVFRRPDGSFYTEEVYAGTVGSINAGTRLTAGGQKFLDLVDFDENGNPVNRSVFLGNERVPGAGGGGGGLTEKQMLDYELSRAEFEADQDRMFREAIADAKKGYAERLYGLEEAADIAAAAIGVLPENKDLFYKEQFGIGVEENSGSEYNYMPSPYYGPYPE